MLAPSHSTSGAPCLAQSPRSVAIFQGMLKCSGTPPIFMVGSTTWECRLQGAEPQGSHRPQRAPQATAPQLRLNTLRHRTQPVVVLQCSRSRRPTWSNPSLLAFASHRRSDCMPFDMQINRSVHSSRKAPTSGSTYR